MRALLFTTTALVASAAGAQDAPFVLGELVAEAPTRTERPIQDTPVAAAVVPGPINQRVAFDRSQASDFSELLADVPGLTIQGGPRGVAQTPNIRGFSDDQIVLRVDGGRQNFNLTHRGRFFVDPEFVKQVEVARGAGSSLYGSGALGGVVSLETLDAADLIAEGETFGGRATLGYADNGDGLRSSFIAASDFGAVDLTFGYAVRDIRDDLEDGDGNDIAFSAFKSANAILKVGYAFSAASRVELSYANFTDEGEIPAAANGAQSNSNPIVDRDGVVEDWRLTWEFDPKDDPLIDLTAVVYSNKVDIEEDRIDTPRFDETDYETLGFEVVNRSDLVLGVPVSLVYGLEYFQDEQTARRDGGPRGSFPDAEAQTTGVFAEATFAVSDQIDVSVGGRFDVYERDPDNAALEKVEEDFFSPRVAVSYRPTDEWQIYGNIARAFRAPSLSQLYNDGLHFAGTAGNPFVPVFAQFPDNFFVPNPDLKPEKSTQLEIGTRYAGDGVFKPEDRLSFSVNVYYAKVEDYIDVNVDAGQVAIPPFQPFIGGTTSTENVDATLWGLEAEAAYDAASWFASAALTIPRGSADDDDEELGSIPQDKLSLTVGVRPFEGWEFGGRATFAAEQDNVDNPEDAVDEYMTMDFFGSYAPPSGPLKGVIFRAGIDNAFDETYSVFPTLINQPGRTAKFSVTYEF
ncbi:MAG: TonB-dependent hemoglobin/transferrin/lactoferrin family receptor [Pseudomonadota bacterium]